MEHRVVTDTTNFFSIDYGDVIHVDQNRYKITGHERERRFGMDDPKFWVKRAVDLDTGEKKVIKLNYLETFETSLGGITIKRFRNPDKESDILELVKNNPYLMHGITHRDSKGNNIRVLDIVHGPNFYVYLGSLEMDYETYFHTALPEILKKLVRAFEAIRLLHSNGFNHGDIRNDHIIVEKDTGNYVWIDFDYDYQASENPYALDIFGLGKILIYTIGKGFHTHYAIVNDNAQYGDLAERLEIEDFSVLDKGRFLNIKKIYPDVPNILNDILMHFSKGANVYYELVEEVIEDVNRCLYSIW
ncbi:MAG: protein kinase [Deltaproteobacteria bacterium]|nr:protein kinase [Deltaproteobacteria bacterium]